MNRISCLLFLSLFASGLSAQIGVATYYNVNTLRNAAINEAFTGDYLNNGPEIAVNYWLRLPNKRVEFLPTLFYNQADIRSERATNYQFGVQLKTNIYPFDFGGDCDCPTFGKQGPQLQKGFFVQIAPGYTINRMNYDEELTIAGERVSSFSNSFLTLAGSVGIDIGLSNFLTVTPTVGYRVGFGGVDEIDFSSSGVIDSEPLYPATLQLGLHLGFRLDADKY